MGCIVIMGNNSTRFVFLDFLRHRRMMVIVVLVLILLGLAIWRIGSAVRLSDHFRVQASNSQWQEIRNDQAGFAVSFPGSPDQATESVMLGDELVPSLRYWSVLRNGTSYSLQIINYPDSVDLTQPDLSLGRTIKALLADTPGLQLGQVKRINDANQRLSIVSIKEPTGGQRDYQLILRDKTLIVMVATGPTSTNPEVDRFFASFRYLSESDKE